MSRLFVAIWLPESVIQRLSDTEQPKDPGVRWVPIENRHITLRFLGDADPDEVIGALALAELPAAVARLGPAFDSFGGHSLVIPADGLDELAATVSRSVGSLGEFRSTRRFVGHVTVAKLRRGARPTRSIGQRFGAEFDVDEIALVESTLRPDGAEYETLATWDVGR